MFTELLDKNYNDISWFHGCITRANACKLLHNVKIGTFLVRRKKDNYVISLKTNINIMHFLILKNNNNYEFIGHPNYYSNCIIDIVLYYNRMPPSNKSGILLKYILNSHYYTEIMATTINYIIHSVKSKKVTIL